MVGTRITTESRPGPEAFARERAKAEQRKLYEWDRLPGLPPFCRDLPSLEKTSRLETEQFLYDLGTSVVEAVLSKRSFAQKLRRKGHQLDAYDYLRPYGRKPITAEIWRHDREFARQRLNGVNPLQIKRVDEMPAHLRVDDARVAAVLPAGATLAQLRDQGRLYACDWHELVDVPVNLGRFLTAPTALFWVDDTGVLMPLAIQLDREFTIPPETGQKQRPLVFTPADDHWLWMTARAHVQSADAAYHETVIHLLRTHLVMETVWVAANRGLAPQHPVHQLLAPHFQGTIAINRKARTELIVPGGPIDSAISVGTAGAYWLINQGLNTFSFGDLDPVADLAARQVDDTNALGGYHYRDDAVRLWHIISDFVAEALRQFYPDDDAVRADVELADWARELSADDCGAMVGLPLSNGKFERFEDLHHVIRQVVFTVSAEHSAVNNGQYDIFGCIPNSPGALFLPPPTSMEPSNEGAFTYGLPPFTVAETQIALVHLLSTPAANHLGDYPADWFHEFESVRIAVDRFRARLDALTIEISDRNATLDVPYTYLDPGTVAVSISV